MKLFETVVSLVLFAAVSSMVFPMAFSTLKVCQEYRDASRELSHNRFAAQSFRCLCRSGEAGKKDFEEFERRLELMHKGSRPRVKCIGFSSDLRSVMELTWHSGNKVLRVISLSGGSV